MNDFLSQKRESNTTEASIGVSRCKVKGWLSDATVM